MLTLLPGKPTPAEDSRMAIATYNAGIAEAEIERAGGSAGAKGLALPSSFAHRRRRHFVWVGLPIPPTLAQLNANRALAARV